MLKEDFRKYLAWTSDFSFEIEVERAEGVWLYGPECRRWMDFISGICVNNVGHGSPEVLDAIRQQYKKYLHTQVYGEAIMEPQVAYARRLIELLGGRFEQVFFTNSGTEATEASLKLAKKYTGRRKLLSFCDAYHGSTHGSLSVGGNPAKREGYGPFLPDTDQLLYNDRESLARIDGDTAAVIVEPIQGAGGVVLPEPGFLQALRGRCDETGALMILDEIQTGFGRTGSLFAFMEMGFEPDILLLAKALGGGLPLGAIVSRREILDVIRRDPPFGHITTFGGNALSCAAGLAALEKILSQGLMERIPGLEAILREEIQHPAIRMLRGKGLMYAVLFEDEQMCNRVMTTCLELGLITVGFLNISNGLRICPPLVISEEELRWGCQILIQAIEKYSQVE